MTMIGEYRRITLGQLYDLQDALRNNSNAVDNFLYPEERRYDKADPRLQIGKAWHGIHFLLNGSRYEGEPPLVYVVMGGTEIGEERGYGRVRYLMPEQIKEASRALGYLDKAEQRRWFDPAAFEAAGIYPGGWLVGEQEEAFEWLWDHIIKVHTFFTDAICFCDVMLLYLS